MQRAGICVIIDVGCVTYPATQWPLTEHLLCPKDKCAVGPASPQKGKRAKAAMPGTKHPLHSSCTFRFGIPGNQVSSNLLWKCDKTSEDNPNSECCVRCQRQFGAMVRHTLTAFGIVSTFNVECWVSYLTSLCLSLSIYKMGRIVPLHRVDVRSKEINTRCVAKTELDTSSMLYKYVCLLSCLRLVWLFATSWTVACQVPLFIGFSRQEYWSGLPCAPPGGLLNPEIKPASPLSPTLQVESFPLSHQGIIIIIEIASHHWHLRFHFHMGLVPF